MNHYRRKLLLGCASLCAISAVPPVFAKGPRIRLPIRGLLKGSKHSGPVLSRQELKECLIYQNETNSREDQLYGLDESLKSQAGEIDKLESFMQQQKPLVNEYSQSSVDNFNALIRKQKSLVNQYNSDLVSFNQQVSLQQSQIDLFNQKCVGHQYYETDMNVLKLGNRLEGPFNK